MVDFAPMVPLQDLQKAEGARLVGYDAVIEPLICHSAEPVWTPSTLESGIVGNFVQVAAKVRVLAGDTIL